MVFIPNSETFSAFNILCVCEQCAVKYGSCEKFTEYELVSQPLNEVSLRTDNSEEVDDIKEIDSDFIYPGSAVVVSAEEK